MECCNPSDCSGIMLLDVYEGGDGSRDDCNLNSPAWLLVSSNETCSFDIKFRRIIEMQCLISG